MLGLKRYSHARLSTGFHCRRQKRRVCVTLFVLPPARGTGGKGQRRRRVVGGMETRKEVDIRGPRGRDLATSRKRRGYDRGCVNATITGRIDTSCSMFVAGSINRPADSPFASPRARAFCPRRQRHLRALSPPRARCLRDVTSLTIIVVTASAPAVGNRTDTSKGSVTESARKSGGAREATGSHSQLERGDRERERGRWQGDERGGRRRVTDIVMKASSCHLPPHCRSSASRPRRGFSLRAASGSRRR